MDELWAEVAAELPAQPATPPAYITDCATFRAVPDAAIRVGESFHRAVHQIESFYCQAYKINAKGQSLFRGRGLQYELNNTEQKKKKTRKNAKEELDTVRIRPTGGQEQNLLPRL